VPTFALRPLSEEQFDAASPCYHSFTFDTRRAAAEVWADLHSDTPLQWCTGLKRVRWTSARPHGVGATREVTLANGLRVQERYFRWEEGEGDYVNAFVVERGSLPLFRRFGERYSVTATETGSRFTWEFDAELPVPAALHRLVRPVVARDIARLHRDSLAHFGSLNAEV